MSHPPTDPWLDWIDQGLHDLQERSLLRRLRPISARSAVHVETEAGPLILFSSNDYLGLAFHPQVRRAVAEAVQEWGMGPRGAALVCGYTKHHEALEWRLASLKKVETALLFPTGYAANLAVLSSLADEETVVFTDILNHASIVDGGRLARQAGARVKVYRHRDANHLETLLQKSKEPRRLIVTDSVFSMDGDVAPLADLIDLKQEYGALLVVDEAHGTLVFGEKGGGVTEALGVSQGIDIHVGTLSKAFGAQGGFVATNSRMRDWILNRGRSFVFSTALPVPVVIAASAALEVSTTDPSLRESLWRHVAFLSNALGRTLESPIVPIVLGDNDRTLAASAAFLEAGFHVPAIRPPTVPRGTSRLRVALSAAHSEEDVRALAQALQGT